MEQVFEPRWSGCRVCALCHRCNYAPEVRDEDGRNSGLFIVDGWSHCVPYDGLETMGTKQVGVLFPEDTPSLIEKRDWKRLRMQW